MQEMTSRCHNNHCSAAVQPCTESNFKPVLITAHLGSDTPHDTLDTGRANSVLSLSAE